VKHSGGRIASAGMALLVGSCGLAPPASAPPDPREAARAAREARMNQAWQNHPVAELLRAMGPPRLLLDIPGGGNPPGMVFVYARDAATGCLDAFAVSYGGEVRVRQYQCR
jgi:hypothetical protein